MKKIKIIATAALLLLIGTTLTLWQGAGSEWDTLNQEGMKLHQQVNYGRAVIVTQKALEVAEANVGPDHPDVAQSLNLLAELYRIQGNYAQAEPLYVDCRRVVFEVVAHDEEERIAEGIHERFIERSLTIREKALGPDHPHVAMSLNNLASLYHAQGYYAQAEPLYERSLAIWEKALGPDHPDVAQSLENLAVLYRATGWDKEALELENNAARIRAIKR